MISAVVSKKNGLYKSFTCSGHAGYDDYGKDIICSAVSILVINTANAIEALTDNSITGHDDEELYFEFNDTIDSQGILLMDALVMGLKEIQANYGNEYLRIIIKEV